MKKKIIIASVLLIGLVVITGVLEATNVINIKKDSVNNSVPTKSEEAVKSDTQNPESPEPSQEINSKATPQKSPTTNQAPSFDPKISLDVSTSSGGTIRLFAKFASVSEGTCELTIKNGDKVVEQTDTIYKSDDFSSCAGFSERKENMGSGDWQFIFKLKTGGKEYSATTSYLVQ